MESEVFTYEKFISGLKNGEFKRALVMTGPGISASAGIPDLMSPITAKMANISLPEPKSLFDLNYFQEKPEAFYKVAKTFLNQESLDPTLTHQFCKLLHSKKMVFKYMTQNVDNLEIKTGFKSSEICQANGANTGASGSKCRKPQDRAVYDQHVAEGKIMYCNQACKCPVKPDINFKGEPNNKELMRTLNAVCTGNVDLVIIIGSSLSTASFNSVLTFIPRTVPQVLINVSNNDMQGFDFCDQEMNPERLFLGGKSDEVVQKIIDDCWWQNDIDYQIQKSKSLPAEEKKSDNLVVAKKASKVEENNDCVHCTSADFVASIEAFDDVILENPAAKSQRMICMKCKFIGLNVTDFDSKKHADKENHPIHLRLETCEYFCFKCKKVVVNQNLKHHKKLVNSAFWAETMQNIGA